jgi:hypothetical protein
MSTNESPPSPLSIMLTARALSALEQWFEGAIHSIIGSLQDVATPLSTPVSTPSSRKSVHFSSTVETATIVGSSIQRDDDEYKDEGGVQIQSSAAPSDSESSPPLTSNSTDEINTVLPLGERMPSIPDLLSYLRSHHRVKQILESLLIFNNEMEIEQFTNAFFLHDPSQDEDFWLDTMDYTLQSIQDNIPNTRGELKKCHDSYYKDMDFLIEEHFFMRDLDIYQGTPWEGHAKLRSLSGRIGYVFCDIIESLITPPNG